MQMAVDSIQLSPHPSIDDSVIQYSDRQHAPPLPETDKVYIAPHRHDATGHYFDLSNVVNSSNNIKEVRSIYILVHYNLTKKDFYNLMHDETDLLVSLAPSESPSESTTPSFMSTVHPIKRDLKINDDDYIDVDSTGQSLSYDWFLYDVTMLLGDSVDKGIRVSNENFAIINSGIMIELGKDEVSTVDRVSIQRHPILFLQQIVRNKRSIDCTENLSFCCRQPFYVNFTTMGKHIDNAHIQANTLGRLFRSRMDTKPAYSHSLFPMDQIPEPFQKDLFYSRRKSLSIIQAVFSGST